MSRWKISAAWLLVLLVVGPRWAVAQQADLILHNGRIATVDKNFSIAQAVAIKEGKILRVGSNDDVLATRGDGTQVVDLAGKFVSPGLIDTHVHPTTAAMIEFDHPIPTMDTIADVLDYIRGRATVVKPGDWIVLRQVFITRLREQRYPTKAELDAAAPHHPVMFATGHDASVNSLALQLSGIDKDFKPTGAGKIERDPTTGEPTGIIRSAAHYIKAPGEKLQATAEQRDQRLLELFNDYNRNGITGIIDRNASEASLVQYAGLRDTGRLKVRIAASYAIGNTDPVKVTQDKIAQVARHPLRKPDPWVRIVGIKMFLDGGMLTGSAYLRQPWGVSKIYAIDDPGYRGILFIAPEVLVPVVRTTLEHGLQYTAHSVGDGAVHALLDAYEEVNRSMPVAPLRPCLTHANFQSAEAVAKAAQLGVVCDIQPVWLYSDAHTLVAQFGYDRLRYFQPLKSLFAAGVTVGGGSDHMHKIGAMRAINIYNPFLGMWVAVTRKSRYYDRPLHPEEALTREQALQLYTINGAKLMFLEDQIGSLEPGKQADLVVFDRDLLNCPTDDLPNAQALSTYVGGKLAWEKK